MRAVSLLGSLLLSACSVVGIRTGTEEPRHESVAQLGPAEIRAYAPRRAAETSVPGEPKAALNEGFRRLAGYIFGGNAGSTRIAMTVPVAQADAGAGAGERIAMTAPVSQSPTGPAGWSPAGPAGWSIRFFLPTDLSDPPAPKDSRIRIVTVPAETFAVLRFSGSPTESAIAARRAELLALLAPSPWVSAGPPAAWFYDPPWTLPPLRRNEVAVPVTRR